METVGVRTPAAETCVIVNCNADATSIVKGPNGERRVCRKCRDELMAVFGFELVKP